MNCARKSNREICRITSGFRYFSTVDIAHAQIGTTNQEVHKDHKEEREERKPQRMDNKNSLSLLLQWLSLRVLCAFVVKNFSSRISESLEPESLSATGRSHLPWSCLQPALGSSC